MRKVLLRDIAYQLQKKVDKCLMKVSTIFWRKFVRIKIR